MAACSEDWLQKRGGGKCYVRKLVMAFLAKLHVMLGKEKEEQCKQADPEKCWGCFVVLLAGMDFAYVTSVLEFLGKENLNQK